MTLRERAAGSNPSLPSLTTIADFAEYITLLTAAVLVLTVAALGAAGIVAGFTVSLVVLFGQFALGIVLIGLSFLGLSLLIGLIEDTYYVESEPEDGETLPEQAAEEQEGNENEPNVEQIGEARAPEEHRVK